ncbi:hypothetical protein BDF20DRAFT_837279 [Mycotypha africana]|uniref:uncharacterized protein n=1 Tax=Mycotypha africana TaxID=64632 RepID=UPI002300D922|nr:uncharacterized protein BDF20DRAFT_837279 [Mycotypha africana]KAI8973326.1 hypothetical protein BDF20DRAFT_837279 [Mycotypha africana]
MIDTGVLFCNGNIFYRPRWIKTTLSFGKCNAFPGFSDYNLSWFNRHVTGFVISDVVWMTCISVGSDHQCIVYVMCVFIIIITVSLSEELIFDISMNLLKLRSNKTAITLIKQNAHRIWVGIRPKTTKVIYLEAERRKKSKKSP